jgi:aldehyde dehydrogenase (NAD+)
MDRCLIAAYKQVKIGNPLDESTLMGPLVSRDAVKHNAFPGLELIQRQGGEILYGGKHLGGCFVEPALVRAKPGMPIVNEEIFRADSFICSSLTSWKTLSSSTNAVPQGLFIGHVHDQSDVRRNIPQPPRE